MKRTYQKYCSDEDNVFTKPDAEAKIIEDSRKRRQLITIKYNLIEPLQKPSSLEELNVQSVQAIQPLSISPVLNQSNLNITEFEDDMFADTDTLANAKHVEINPS